MAFFLSIAALRAETGPSIHFLSPEEAAGVLADDSDSPFFTRMQEREIRARTSGRVSEGTLEERRQAIRELFRAGPLPFSEEEQRAIGETVRFLHRSLADRAGRVANTPWRLIKLAPALEGGLPHTRGDCIVLPANFTEAAARLFSTDPASARPMLVHVLLHEQMHVLQKKNPGHFDALYEKWGFVRVDGLERTGDLATHQILNPDTPQENWAWKDASSDPSQPRAFWPLTLLNPAAPDESVSLPRHLRVVAVELEPHAGSWRVKTDVRGQPLTRPLEEEEAYRSAFGLRSNHSHPDEISAELAARLLGGSILAPERVPVFLERFRRDLETVLAAPLNR